MFGLLFGSSLQPSKPLLAGEWSIPGVLILSSYRILYDGSDGENGRSVFYYRVYMDSSGGEDPIPSRIFDTFYPILHDSLLCFPSIGYYDKAQM